MLDDDASAMMAKDMQGEMAQDDECPDELEGGLFIKRRRITGKRHDVLQLLQSGANEGERAPARHRPRIRSEWQSTLTSFM